MNYQLLSTEDLSHFESIVGLDFVHADESTRQKYGSDHTEDYSMPPEVVLRPADADQISKILAHCNNRNIPVTPIGALTGLSGGALSLHGGVGLSLERLNKIINIDTDNLQATVEPAVITQVFQEAVEAHGLFYPPDPASKGSCSIGGNLAESSGGPKAVKYGVTRDYILNLEIVLMDGSVMWTGANVLKNATGYDLTRLLVGSEGTLGVITKAVFRLIPKPKFDILLLVPFNSNESACEAVAATFKEGLVPSAMEFMERDALDWVQAHLGIDMPIAGDVAAHLLIEFDGDDQQKLMKDAELAATVAERHGAGEILLAESAAEKERLWAMRRKVGEAVKANSVYKEEDTVVPRFALPKLIAAIKEIGGRYGFKSVCYGHAGDGNLHVNIIKGDLSDEFWNHELKAGIRELFEVVVSLGGTISGEHGIGLVQKEYLDIALDKNQRRVMQAIKNAFDSKGLLNPGKIL